MSLKLKFDLASSGWLAQERQLQARSALGTGLAQSVLPSAPDQVLREALGTSPGFFAPVDRVRGNILQALSTPDGFAGLITLAVDATALDIQELQALADGLQETVQTLADGLEAPPTKATAEAIQRALDAVEDAASRMEEAERDNLDQGSASEAIDVVDLILGLVDQDALDPDQVRSYVSSNPVAKQAFERKRTQHVEQLGDRFWRLYSTEDATISPGITPQQVPVTDKLTLSGLDLMSEEGLRIRDLAGVHRAMLSADGQLIVQGGAGLPQNVLRSFLLVPAQPQQATRVSATAATYAGELGELGSKQTALEEALRFEVWACVLLDLSERIDSQLARIENKINGIYARIRQNMTAIVSGAFLGGLPTIEVDWKGALSRASDALSAELGVAPPTSALVAILDSFQPISLGGDAGVWCDLDQTRYCTVHTELVNLKAELEKLEQRLRLKLTGQQLQDLISALGWNPQAVLDQLNDALAPLDAFMAGIGQARLALRQEVCVWVRDRLASTPPSVSQISALCIVFIPALVGVLAALTPAGLGFVPSLSLAQSLGGLKSMGLGSMAASLEALDLSQALGLTDDQASRAGRVASVLEEAASATQSIARAQQLQALADGASDRHDQFAQHQKVRASVQARYHERNSVKVAEAVTQKGSALCFEVDREVNRSR